ncbi:trypsin-like cysteine/serine peptidase domain-containing protein [Aspergillus sergii]|uniref:Serine protease n=1 Tax=Aspergillus sergii TaxID=1034303 RepID=A0A5N6WYL5_9EURO|nr:trypsin-like cysteine/serine peptidase domain-containing protein [Aspergillus sergii]
MSKRLASWSFEEIDDNKESVDSIAHPDHGPGHESILDENEDHRERVDPRDFAEGGKYRSIVKVQTQFTKGKWTMGTGWLIRKDLVVTAGHNVWSRERGQAQQVKCWIGYQGRSYVNKKSVQHRMALNVVTTESWVTKNGDRLHDVAFIQVRKPFTGNLRPFEYIETPLRQTKRVWLQVVGYPGDKYVDYEGRDDKGARMWWAQKETTWDLEYAPGHMLEYRIDTFGGQSGAPVLLAKENKLVAIGTHCYGGGEDLPNSGNPIGGTYGNNYDEFAKMFKGSSEHKPKPLGSMEIKYHDPSSPGGEDERGEESFWDVFNKVVKVGSATLPIAGSFLGPIGTLVGTAAGGLLGALARPESFDDADKQEEEELYEAAAQRALLAEATLQSIIRLGRSRESDQVFDSMKAIWKNNYVEDVGNLQSVLDPVLTDCVFRATIKDWYKAKGHEPSSESVEFSPLQSRPKNPFINELFEADNEEESFNWVGPLVKEAIIKAKPIVFQKLKDTIDKIIKRVAEESGEDVPQQDGNVLQRALLADYALQAIETLPADTLQKLKLLPSNAGEEESIIDSIKTHAQRFGPVVLKYGKQAIKKGIPLLLRELKKQLEAANERDSSRGSFPRRVSTTALKNRSGTNVMVVSSAAHDEPTKLSNGDDSPDYNPDSPVSEPESPVTPDSEEE